MQVAVHENMNGMAVRRYAGTLCHAFPWIALTLLERLFNDFLLITVYCTEFVDFLS